MGILVESLTWGVYRYENLKDTRNSICFKKLEEQIHSLEEPSKMTMTCLLLAFIDFVNGKLDSSLKNIDLWLRSCSDQITYLDLLSLVLFFKQGFRGMWNTIGRMFGSMNAVSGLESTCNALETLYYPSQQKEIVSSQQEEIVDALSKVICENDEIILAKELIGLTYFDMQMWENAIAYFEKVLETNSDSRMFEDGYLYFNLAWSYGKTRELKKEELNYKKLLSLDPGFPFALNNLGYCLYKQKKYTEAKKVFEQCIAEKKDLRYSVNNMLRVLIALRQDDEASEFAAEHKDIVSKDLQRRIGQGPKAKTRPAIYDESSDDVNQPIQAPPIMVIGQGQQFSSEKILEDELTRRIEKGQNCFGVQLSIFKQKGKYGRQFIMPVGVVDILANDAEGNLYVIEVKKDSGYCDVFDQVSRYVGWLEENMIYPEKKVYGIIVVNKPSDELKMRVRNNPKMKLYDYSVLYQEII